MSDQSELPDEGDGGEEPSGAIDHGFEEGEVPAEEVILGELDEIPYPRGPLEQGIVLDLVTRQLLHVKDRVADDLVEYYEAEEFNLLTYGVHPLLPVRIDDPVFECVYLSDVNAENLTKFEEAKTYDFPRGRLAHVPTERAWIPGGGE